MRRLLAVAFSAVLCASFVGCSSQSPTTNESAGTDGGSQSSAAGPEEQVLNLYSSRHYNVDKEIYKLFTEETGIKINLVQAQGPQLVERIKREKNNPSADVFLTVGAESIYQLNTAGALAPSMSDTIKANIEEKYRGENWMGVVSRARVIAYKKDKVDPASITTYEDLTKPEWKDQILVRSSNSSYNQALLASFIEIDGEEKAKQWAEGVVANFAQTPKGNDISAAKSVAAGVGDLAIMNSYYWARLDKSSDPNNKKVVEEVGLIFPKNTHVNLSYASVLTGAKHPQNALKFLEFLSSEKVQSLIAEKNGEFPLNPKVKLPEPQASWPKFTVQDVNYEELGKYIPVANEIFDEVNWK